VFKTVAVSAKQITFYEFFFDHFPTLLCDSSDAEVFLLWVPVMKLKSGYSSYETTTNAFSAE